MSFKYLDIAKEDGFEIDESCYPWVAYKGPRFNPTEWHYTHTQTEHDLTVELQILKIKINRLNDWCNSGFPPERRQLEVD